MKNKPHSHRSQNTFRFQGFNEKVNSIQVSSRNYILKKLESDSNVDTFLWQSIQHWKELNLTSGFRDFVSALGSEYQTVAQVVLNEACIADTIKTHLETDDVLALPGVFHALVAFARDIPDLFYDKHFYPFMQQLVAMVPSKTRCHETIENVFVTFVSLFILLQKYIRSNFFDLYVKGGFCVLLSKQHPWYINELAAQAVGSLVRKFPNKREMIISCLRRLSKNPAETEGVGRFLFQTLKLDVARRLHSSAASTLSLLVELVTGGFVPRSESMAAVVFCLKQLSSHVTTSMDVAVSWQETWKQESQRVWPILLDQLITHEKSSGGLDDASVCAILEFVFELVQFKHAALVVNFDAVLRALTAAAKTLTSNEAGKRIADIVAKLVSSSHYAGSSAALSLFLSCFGAAVPPSAVFYFVELVVDAPLFEDEVLPYFLGFVLSVLKKENDEDVKEEVLSCITAIVTTKVPPVRGASDLGTWFEYSLDFRELPSKEDDHLCGLEGTPAKLLEHFLCRGLETDASNVQTVIKSCLCLPHVAPLVGEDFVPYLCWTLNSAMKMLERGTCCPLICEDPKPPKKRRKSDPGSGHARVIMNVSGWAVNETSRKLIFLISVVIETLHHLLSPTNFLAIFDNKGRILLSALEECSYLRDSVHFLKAVDIYLTSLAAEGVSEVINFKTFRDLYPVLAPGLASYKSLVRLSVSHILSLFPLQRAPSTFGESEENVFATMFEVESSPISPLDYKERLRILQCLSVDFVNLNQLGSMFYDQGPLLFLIGQLYINFKEFWAPVLQSITQYAYALPEEVFWPLWVSNLKLASHFVMRSLCGKTLVEKDSTAFADPSLGSFHASLISHPGYALLNARPNFLNFRDHLWQAMQTFPDICEKQNKDVVTLFFDFLTNELFPADFNIAPTQDVAARPSTAEEGEDDEEQALFALAETSSSVTDDDENVTPGTLEGESEVVDAHHRVRKAPTKSLCQHLALFAKFHNPKVIYKSKDLEEVYREFLSHPYLKAQKLGLDCIVAYKHKFVTPYKESLYNILDDKSFKNEITLFDIEGKGVEEGGRSLKEQHRKDFMPILMRILYGKMLYKTGSHTSGKANIGLRKSIVIRFLAGANEAELDTFLNLSFDILLSRVEGDALEVVERARRAMDPRRVVPLKRLQGALGTLETLFDKMGNMLVGKRPFLLKVILFILGMCGTLLENRSKICSHFLPLLKNLRHMALQKLTAFFASYLDYLWSPNELEAVYQAAVWPILARLPDEGIYTPTPLLRLFCCWGENPAYHPLLARHHPEDESLTPMPFIMKLINHPKCSSGVVSTVYDLIGHLLRKSPKDAVEEEAERDVQQPFKLPLDNALALEKRVAELCLCDLTFGESIVVSCMDIVLVNLKDNLTSLKRDQAINKRFLAILIHLAQWVKNKTDAKELLDSIVPLLKKNCVKQNEKVCYLLGTTCNLIPTVDGIGEYAQDFLCMFSSLNGRSARIALCQVIKAFYPAGGKDDRLAEWCSDLNAWSEEMAENIDSEVRLRCSREINAYLKSTDVFKEDVALFLIHQNMWVLCQGDEQALRDLAVLCLQNLIDMMARLQPNYFEVKKMVDTQLLPLLKAGLKDKRETVRNAVMKVLGTAVHKCHAFNARLRNLFVLADVQDAEVDFFLSMAHLQRGRRAKALTRLAQQLNEGKLHLQTETMTDFVLPVVSVYLFKDEYATDHGLLTASVLCVGALARKLPWYNYQNLLRYYLNLVARELSQLKLGVRVLEAVIDAFHEDISHFGESKPRQELLESNKPREDKEVNDLNESAALGEDPEPDAVSLDKEAKARRVYYALTQVIIPQIQKTLSKRSVRDTEHKVNKKRYPEDEDIKRIPLALALIKLLKKLPKELLELNVNSVFTKLVELLKSRAESIRRESRNMLGKVMMELGGNYLSSLVSDMNSFLTRGYQSHVMVFTLHSVLTGLQDTLCAPHVAPCLSEVVQICLEDLFGDKAAEKGVAQLGSKVREVKAEKGYAILGIVAGLVAVDHLQTLMVPLKEKLQTHDKKVVNKIIICLQKVRDGLQRNGVISIEHKSLFIYGILNEKIKELAEVEGPRGQSSATKEKDQRIVRPDSFLLEPEPRRVGLTPKTSHRTTSHALVEFSLSLLFHLLKFKHFVHTDNHHRGLLDAYVPIMSRCLLSEYPDVSIEALRTIGALLKFNLPSLKENLPKIVGQMFVILNKFASSGLTKGKLFQLVQLDFKTIAAVMEVPFYKLDPEHCKVLLYYARNNIEDPNQHHSSFTILHAIIRQKIQMDELHQLMVAIQEMSITSTSLNMLDQARRTYLIYFLNYPKKKVQYVNALLFFLKNVSYDVPQGRMSASLMLSDLISKYSSKRFDLQLEVTMWFKLTEQLIKDDNREQKLMLQRLLRLLFLKSERKNALLDKCLILLEDDLMKSKVENALVVNMAAQSLIAMLDVQISDLPRAVGDVLLPRIVELLHPARYHLSIDGDEAVSKEAACFDLTLTSLLELFMKLMDLYCHHGNPSKWNSHVKDDVWKYVKDHLLYPNLKVRLTSAVILGHLFALYPIGEGKRPPIACSKKLVESLVVDLCEQLNTHCPIESPLLADLGLAVVRNLIYLVRQAQEVPIKLKKSKNVETTPSDLPETPPDALNNDASFLQENESPAASPDNSVANGAYAVLHRVGVIAYDELRRKGRHNTFRRECLLNLIAGMVVVLDDRFEQFAAIVVFVINHLTRELSDRSLPEGLAARTKEVADLVRERVGVERYSEETVRIQAVMERRRTDRKARERVRIVSMPEVAMRKKAKKHAAKKESRKRKFTELKLRPNKRRRLKNMAFVRG